MLEDFKTKYVALAVVTTGLSGDEKVEIKTYCEQSESSRNRKDFTCFRD